MTKRSPQSPTISLESVSLLAMEWTEQLTPELRRRVVAETRVGKVLAEGFVCRKGEPVAAWTGVLTGLVKLASTMPNGRSVSFTGVPAGGWFGEGSLLKNESRRYDAIALRDSLIAYMPRSTFILLLDSSVAFNRFLLNQLNERLGQFIGMVERDRALEPEARLATELAALFNPQLYPGNKSALAISQEELAHLVGLSRQRVNRALKKLVEAGLIQVDYKELRILDLDGLRHFESS